MPFWKSAGGSREKLSTSVVPKSKEHIGLNSDKPLITVWVKDVCLQCIRLPSQHAKSFTINTYSASKAEFMNVHLELRHYYRQGIYADY